MPRADSSKGASLQAYKPSQGARHPPCSQMPTFTDNVRRIVPRIPAGKVLDYKTVACMAGSARPRSPARAVGRAMETPGETPGWHRVVTVSGELSSPKPERQRELLVRDQVKFKANDVVDMSACRCGRITVKSSI